MKLIKNYDKFINEAQSIPEAPVETTTGGSCKCAGLNGEVELYRLTSHPVVDLSQPGEYYVCDKESLSPELLSKKDGDEFFVITVKCDSSNIDVECSEKECSEKGCDACVCIKDDTQCEIVSVEPFNK